MTEDEIDALPYRPCVGIMICNAEGGVFAGQRLDGARAAVERVHVAGRAVSEPDLQPILGQLHAPGGRADGAARGRYPGVVDLVEGATVHHVHEILVLDHAPHRRIAQVAEKRQARHGIQGQRPLVGRGRDLGKHVDAPLRAHKRRAAAISKAEKGYDLATQFLLSGAHNGLHRLHDLQVHRLGAACLLWQFDLFRRHRPFT